uniref:Uncharacterized protein n=1 Tax=Glossina austeni TaxID=7395 RepID=A0A1A9UQB3_GLOAU
MTTLSIYNLSVKAKWCTTEQHFRAEFLEQPICLCDFILNSTYLTNVSSHVVILGNIIRVLEESAHKYFIINALTIVRMAYENLYAGKACMRSHLINLYNKWFNCDLRNYSGKDG